MRIVAGSALIIGIVSTLVSLRKQIQTRVVTSIGVVPGIEIVSFDGGCHCNNWGAKRLVQGDVVLRCFHGGDGLNGRLNV
jgi:hypothetical protein